jgi:DNA-binding MarR family transcriptional regulator
MDDKENRLTLDLLNAIDRQSNLSQRSLSQQMGIALGLTNSYLKRCARKGLVKINEAPANRYLYYLTPKGFAEKARLTGLYLANSLTFYRQASESCSAIFDYCRKNKIENVLLCGMSDLAEIALIRAMEANISIDAIYDPSVPEKEFFTRPVVSDLNSDLSNHVFLLTDLNSPYETYKTLLEKVDKSRILVPDILGIKMDEQETSE